MPIPHQKEALTPPHLELVRARGSVIRDHDEALLRGGREVRIDQCEHARAPGPGEESHARIITSGRYRAVRDRGRVHMDHLGPEPRSDRASLEARVTLASSRAARSIRTSITLAPASGWSRRTTTWAPARSRSRCMSRHRLAVATRRATVVGTNQKGRRVGRVKGGRSGWERTDARKGDRRDHRRHTSVDRRRYLPPRRSAANGAGVRRDV